MARRTPDARLESRESRSRLASRGKPHYRLLEPGLHIGYRRLKGRKGRPAVAGTWVARHYIGGRSYVVEKIGTADDFSDADGTIIRNFAQAQDKARTRMVRRAQSANGIVGPLTVRAAVEGYLESSKPTARARSMRATARRRTSTRRSAMLRWRH